MQGSSVISTNAFTVDYPASADSFRTASFASGPPVSSWLAHEQTYPPEVRLREDTVVYIGPPANSQKEADADGSHHADHQGHPAEQVANYQDLKTSTLQRSVDTGLWSEEDVSHILSDYYRRPRRSKSRRRPLRLLIPHTDASSVDGSTAQTFEGH